MDSNNTVFEDLKQSVEETPKVSEIDSLCLNCKEDGVTRMLFTRIPFFREVVIMSFECPHCHWKNNELQPASRIQDKGIRYKLSVKNLRDLNRQVVKTEWAEISIPQLEFQVTKQTGLITTLEGIIDRAIEGLQSTIPRIVDDPESVVKISSFINELTQLKTGEKEFTLVVDDPTGNSFVENLLAPEDDPQLFVEGYTRTLEQNKLIGVVADDATKEMEENPLDVDPNELIKGEVHEFPTNCHSCNVPCLTKMKVTDIPHFKQIIIMATTCEACGNRTNEVKSGSGVDEKGIRITIHVKEAEQLTYDVVKSGHCSIEIPELELELHSSGSGRYTTVEGLIDHIKNQLKESNPFGVGDSASQGTRNRLTALIARMDNMIGLTIILDDPTGNTYVEKADDIVRYERTFEQNEDLGLNDMRVEGYGEA